MVAALESGWAAIRARHPEIPPVVVVLGAGSTGASAGGVKLGHFAAMRWHHGTDTESDRLPEVFIGGEGLARGPVGMLGTLLHEAAHALADVRQIQDTSRQGRWHNARFKALAEELGIEVTKDSRLGWSPTGVPEATCTEYADTLAELGAALRLSGPSNPAAQPPARPRPHRRVCAAAGAASGSRPRCWPRPHHLRDLRHRLRTRTVTMGARPGAATASAGPATAPTTGPTRRRGG